MSHTTRGSPGVASKRRLPTQPIVFWHRRKPPRHRRPPDPPWGRPSWELPLDCLPVIWDPSFTLLALWRTCLRWFGPADERHVSSNNAKGRAAGLWEHAKLLGLWEEGNRARCLCPSCGARVTSLMHSHSAWRCRACLKHYPKTIELDLARYQFALMIGAYGHAVTVVRRRIYAWATSVMEGAGAVTGETILQVQAAAVLIDIRPTWPRDRFMALTQMRPRRFPPTSGYPSTLEQVVGPLMPLAVIDALLRPDAYLRHYAKCLQNRTVPALNSTG